MSALTAFSGARALRELLDDLIQRLQGPWHAQANQVGADPLRLARRAPEAPSCRGIVGSEAFANGVIKRQWPQRDDVAGAGDRRKFGGQAAIAASGCVSLAEWNLRPWPEPSVPL